MSPFGLISNMEIEKIYDPAAAQAKWYKYWIEKGFFHSEPDEREPYTMVMPPPNVTGVLHMGHVLNNTIQDVLVRRARMLGKNACWVPGTDHASIATEAKVVALLKEKGIKKSDLLRDEFLKYAWEWKEKYGGIIIEQLKTLGCSCDWERTRFTMDKELSDAVIGVFVDLFNKGYIYRGVRMVNWDPKGLTAVSDEEVIYKEEESKLFFVRYKIENTPDDWITIATTRPETILGDTAVCVNPNDPRCKKLVGKYAIIPIVNRRVPIIADDYVDKDFGTGALKITPAHDVNDYNIGLKHNLAAIDTISADGTMSKEAGFYVGEDRFVVRGKIVKELEQQGQIVKVEKIKNKVGHSERTDSVIEPKLSMQWFLKMDKISKPAYDHVLDGTIKLIPEKYINTYRHWMENVHDWCISRQLWWGQQIPAWYCIGDEQGTPKCKEPVVSVAKPAKCAHCGSTNFRQDEDVLDTWFSSWLWPISVFDGFKSAGNPDINYYYPTKDLVTAPEILFFWVARMIIAGYEYRHKEPFSHVYLTGTVRDKLGRKMSKSLGNSPDPLDLIAKYGADGVRVGILLCSPAGNDLTFDESLCEQGRNFANKVWNAFRLIKGWTPDQSIAQSKSNGTAAKWFDSKLNYEMENINDLFSKYRISEALMAIYKLVWDDFCSWYLEMIKPPLDNGKPMIDKRTYEYTIVFFEKILKLLHPFTPFITEEIWHSLAERQEMECIIVSEMPKPAPYNRKIIEDFEGIKTLISTIRNIRKAHNIPFREQIELYSNSEAADNSSDFELIVQKLCNVKELKYNTHAEGNVIRFTMQGTEYHIPFANSIDKKVEKEKIEKEIAYYRGFLKTVMAKLGNEKFVANAKPEIIENEKKKKADTEAKIEALKKQLGVYISV